MIHVVLYNPEIPPNTGNIMRTCMATNSQLHLIKPLGFKLDDKSFLRAGMDYLKEFKYEIYENFEEFLVKNKVNDDHLFILTRFGSIPHSEVLCPNVEEDYYFMFGSETKGLPDYLKEKYASTAFRIPMAENARSLNLSNAVAVVVYEALRKQDYPTLSKINLLEG